MLVYYECLSVYIRIWETLRAVSRHRKVAALHINHTPNPYKIDALHSGWFSFMVMVLDLFNRVHYMLLYNTCELDARFAGLMHSGRYVP